MKVLENSVQTLDSFLRDLHDQSLTDEQRLKHITRQCDSDVKLLQPSVSPVPSDDENPEIDEFVREINAVAAELYDLLKDHPHWCNKFLVIHQLAPDVIAWAKEYDYNGIRANGYWSLIRIAVKLAKLVVDKYRGQASPEKVDHNLELLLDYALIAVDVLKVLRKDSVENTRNGQRSLTTSSNKYFIELFGLLLSIDDKMVAAMYGRYCGFWLCNQSRLTSIMFVTALAIGRQFFSLFI